MSFEIIRNDISTVQADAIVNTANPLPIVGAGTDAAIHMNAGSKLLEARRKIGIIPAGSCAITKAYNLPAKYVIHTVTPNWYDGLHQEAELLKQAYLSSLETAKQYHCKSIAFPLLGAGNCGYPKELALSIAIETFNKFLLADSNQEYHILLVVFDREVFRLSASLTSSIRSYLNDHQVMEKAKLENRFITDINRYSYSAETLSADLEICQFSEPIVTDFEKEESRRIQPPRPQKSVTRIPKFAKQSPTNTSFSSSLEDLLKNKQESFAEYLVHLIDRKCLKDSDVYNNVLMDRRQFNKIKNGATANPKKMTVLQLALGMRLSIDETYDLLRKAGYSISDSDDFDLIVSYCLEHHIYNIIEINCILFEFNAPQFSIA